MKMKKILILFCFSACIFIFSQNRNLSDKLINELQQVKQTDKNLKLVWWIPTEFWRIASQSNNNVIDEQIEYLENILNDYTIIAAGDYSLESENGAVEFKVNNIKNNFTFFGLDEKKMTPLKDFEINNQVLSILNNTLKPLFVQMLGKTGNGIEFFIFNNIKNDKRIINPTESGNIKVEVNKEIFKWNLPLVSLLKQKICPIDQEKMEGNWIFCPFHGEKL